MIDTEIIETDKGAALGFKMNLGYRPPPLLIIQAEKGYIACAYLDEKTIEKVGDSAAIVSGVKTFKEMLKARLKWVSPKAKQLGLEKGMDAETALDKLM